jgi:uncharacterized protein YndB with AHSA1/START domain
VNETLRTVDGRTVLRVERRFGHPPEKVWRAITEPAHLGRWFPSDVEIDPRVGGRISFVFRNGEAPTFDGVVGEFDPPRVIAYNWGDDLLRFELRPDGAGCVMVFTHMFDDRAGAASFAAGWQACLAGLESLLDSRPVEKPTDMNAAHQAYVEAFGLDEGSAEDTADGWRVRFERQLTQPVDAVWATLTGADAPVVGGAAPRGFTTAEVPAGAVTAVDAPALLEYAWAAGRVRWELTNGTGQGARLILTQTGPAHLTDERSTALAAWRAHIELLAKSLLGAAA